MVPITSSTWAHKEVDRARAARCTAACSMSWAWLAVCSSLQTASARTLCYRLTRELPAHTFHSHLQEITILKYLWSIIQSYARFFIHQKPSQSAGGCLGKLAFRLQTLWHQGSFSLRAVACVHISITNPRSAAEGAKPILRFFSFLYPPDGRPEGSYSSHLKSRYPAFLTSPL